MNYSLEIEKLNEENGNLRKKIDENNKKVALLIKQYGAELDAKLEKNRLRN